MWDEHSFSNQLEGMLFRHHFCILNHIPVTSQLYWNIKIYLEFFYESSTVIRLFNQYFYFCCLDLNFLSKYYCDNFYWWWIYHFLWCIFWAVPLFTNFLFLKSFLTCDPLTYLYYNTISFYFVNISQQKHLMNIK